MVAFLESAPLVTAGLQKVYQGSPESFANRVSAYVAVLPEDPTPKGSGGLMARELALFIGLGYRVQRAEATAELTLATVIDAFHRGFHTTYPNRDLGGLLDNARFESNPERRPLYQQFSTGEFRIQPIVPVGSQHETFSL